MLSYPADPDAAVTVVDPRTGYIRAMVGGDEGDYWADRRAGRVNLATGAGGTGRQTGSAFKAFALVAALEHGISPDTTFPAPATIDIPLSDGGIWPVTNADGSGYGTLSLRAATLDSVNTVYAQLMQRLTPEVVVETAERMGMRCCPNMAEPAEPLVPHLSAVLGSNEANTLEMASAYGTLATGGKQVDPLPVITVSDAAGEVLWQADPRPAQVLSPQVAAAADDVLQDVVLYGTGTAANIGRPQIGKTGTDDHHANAWYVGAIPQLSAAVWVGFHQGQIPMEPPRTRIDVLGGTWPAQIWRLLMLRATTRLPAEGFPTPEASYVTVAVDGSQDPPCLPNAFTLPSDIDLRSFLVGTEPKDVCTTPTEVREVVVPSVVGRPQPEAMAVLRAAGFYVRVELDGSTQPEGTVDLPGPDRRDVRGADGHDHDHGGGGARARLAIARAGDPRVARDPEPPGSLASAGDPHARTRHHALRRGGVAALEPEVVTPDQVGPVEGPVEDAERAREPSGSPTRVPSLDPFERLCGTQQDGRAYAGCARHDVAAVMQAVDEVHVQVPRGAEHRGVARGRTHERVAGRVTGLVGLGLRDAGPQLPALGGPTDQMDAEQPRGCIHGAPRQPRPGDASAHANPNRNSRSAFWVCRRFSA